MKIIVGAIAASIIPFTATPAVAQFMPENQCEGVYSKGWCLIEGTEATYAFTWTEDNLVFGYGIGFFDNGVEYHNVLVNSADGDVILEVGKPYNSRDYDFRVGNYSLMEQFAREGVYAEGLIQGYLANE